MRIGILSVCAVSFLIGSASADILRVDDDAAPNGDGSSWGRAFDSLTDALAAANAGDQIWVAGGDYVPELPAGRDATFTIPDSVAIYGGFSGNENSLAQRGNPLSPASTLNGLGSSYHVVTMTNVGSNTILDGLYITKGLADGTDSKSNGGGVFIQNSSPTLRNLDINLCQAAASGSAIYTIGTGTLSMNNCTIQNNTGNAITSGADVSIVDCTIQNNAGSGLSLFGSGIQIIADTTFLSNTSTSSAGAIAIPSASPTIQTNITRCQFRNNTGDAVGGIWYLSTGQHEVFQSTFYNNTGQISGGILVGCSDPNASVRIENSVISGNSATGIANSVGAIAMVSPCSLDLVNIAVVGNSAPSNGTTGGLFVGNGNTRVDNSIFWDNLLGTQNGQANNFKLAILNAVVSVNRTIIELLGNGDPIPPGSFLLGINPDFVDGDGLDNTYGTPDDNFRLQAGSPAIDRGDNARVSIATSVDIYGDSRFVDDPNTPDTGVLAGLPGAIDLGAAEFQPPPVVCLADTNHDGAVTAADFTAWIAAFNTNAPECDQNSDGACTPADFTAWIANFNAGCP